MSENTTAPYDVIIVGGGPIGLACALEAKQANLNYLILEKGCLVNSLYNYPQNMTFFFFLGTTGDWGYPFCDNQSKAPKNGSLRILQTYSTEI